MKAVFLREMASYFIAPAGYVYLAAFYCLAGYEYSVLILNGQAEMSYEFTFLYTVTLLLTPVLTMRLMSEDRKQKTDQMLFAAPVSLGGIVAGKYMAAVVVFLMGIGVTILHAFAIAPFSEINWAIFWGNLAGLSVMGMAGIALCMFTSAHTESQIIAAIGGFACMLVVISLNSLAAVVPFPALQELLYSISFYDRYYNLTMGIFQFSDFMLFFSFAALFFFLTVHTLERRRWSGQ